jgi:hypothetical protein
MNWRSAVDVGFRGTTFHWQFVNNERRRDKKCF